MRRINYTSAAYDTIVLEVPWDHGTDCVPPSQIVIYRRDGDGRPVAQIYHHRGERAIGQLAEPQP